MDRRSLLKMIGAGALATGAAPILAACGGGSNPSDIGNAGKTLAPWPTYVPFTGPTPDAPGDATGVQNLFLKYPQKLVKGVAEKPGDGSKIRAMVISYGTPPKPAAENQFWAAVNKALGVEVEIITVPAADFTKKMPTVMASGDLPDLIMFGAGEQFANEQQFIAAQCQDISEFVSGDAIKAYPALANIPTYSWKGMGRIGGKIFGVPIERPMPGNSLLVNRTALEAVGAPREWDEAAMLKALKDLTADKRWGIGGYTTGFANGAVSNYHAGAHGAPNVWKLDGGKFVSTYGTDNFKAALETMSKLQKAGSYYPDSLTVSQTDMKTHFYNGTVASITDGYGAMLTAADAVGDKFKVDFALPYTKNATPWQGSGRFGYVVFKKASADRIKLLLRVLNWLAAPFGTEEYELANFGLEGVHFTRGADGGIVKTELAKVENPTNVPIKYIAAAPVALYYPGHPDVAQRVYDWEKASLSKSVADPSNGLRSEAWSSKIAEMNKLLGDAITAIVFGRRPLSDWDAVYRDWKNAGGDKAAEEYAKEYAAANG